MNPNHPNWSGRWPRQAREVYNHSLEFEPDPDRYVWYAALVAAGFLLGLLVGGI